MPRSSESVAALASALAKAQGELVNPEKSLIVVIRPSRAGEEERSFRYSPLSSGLDIVRQDIEPARDRDDPDHRDRQGGAGGQPDHHAHPLFRRVDRVRLAGLPNRREARRWQQFRCMTRIAGRLLARDPLTAEQPQELAVAANSKSPASPTPSAKPAPTVTPIGSRTQAARKADDFAQGRARAAAKEITKERMVAGRDLTELTIEIRFSRFQARSAFPRLHGLVNFLITFGPRVGHRPRFIRSPCPCAVVTLHPHQLFEAA
jgi:hypothetical protein